MKILQHHDMFILHFVSNQGAVVGSVFGLVLPMWISIGAYSVGSTGSLPTNTSLCNTNGDFNATFDTTVSTALQTTVATPPDEV